MCSQNAGNVISESPILKISPGPPLESLSMSPPDKTKTLRLCSHGPTVIGICWCSDWPCPC